MPIYEYACLDCGREFEELVRGDEKPACPKCGKKRLERRMSATSGHVAGGAVGLPRPRCLPLVALLRPELRAARIDGPGAGPSLDEVDHAFRHPSRRRTSADRIVAAGNS